MGKSTKISEEVQAQVNKATADGENRTITVVQKTVKVSAMSVREKERVERLVDSRRDNVLGYLDEMKTFAEEANEHVPFSQQDRLDEIQREKAQIMLREEQLDGKAGAEFHAVERFLKEELEAKLTRLDRLKEKIKEKNRREIQAAREQIDKKFERQKAELTDTLMELNQEVTQLEREAKGEKMARRMALTNSFNDLRDQVRDARSVAVEQLWTQTQLPEDAHSVLDRLPDAKHFRTQVSPQRMFQLFDETLNSRGLPGARSISCEECGGTDLNSPGGVDYYCRGCGHRGKFPEEVRRASALPTLHEILQQASSVPRIAASPSVTPDDVESLAEGDVVDAETVSS